MKNYSKALHFTVVILGFVALAGCTGNLSSGGLGGAETTSNGADSTSLTEIEKREPAAAVSIWKSAVSVRVEPGTKAKRVTTVSLGERFEYLGESQVIQAEDNEQKWAKIKLLDGKEGWILEDFILVGGQPAAVLREQTLVYRRPDILTKSDKEFNKFDVIGVKGEGAFVEFKGMRSDDTWFTSGWIKSENIKINPVDVATAVYITKALQLEDKKDQLEELKSIYNSGDFEGSYFLTDLEDMIRKMD